jgi:hypothetical protein
MLGGHFSLNFQNTQIEKRFHILVVRLKLKFNFLMIGLCLL